MKFSEQWLREWVAPPLSTQELTEQLTMSGLEVDGSEPAAPVFSGVTVGAVLSVAPHPDAQKLKVCQVDAGGGQTLQIVCGAPNVHAGMRAPLAGIGARLPGGLSIQPAKLRGVDSQGMLCSARELGLSEDAAGLMALPPDAPVGRDLREYLQLDDMCIEVDFTPNRGDCLSVLGLAREIGALNGCPVKPAEFAAVEAVVADTFPVAIHNLAACPRYLGRVVKNIDPAAPTPLWMKERLRRSGLRSINVAVDITNYVLLELGQPMHAFDLQQLDGGIQVRNARPGESLTLLDGRGVALDDETLVIADQARPLALAGIMGGEATGVNAGTRDVFLESAYFAPLTLAGCARRYGVQTDSSYRFERGVDPTQQRRAIERATALLVEIAGGQPGPVSEVADAAHLPVPPSITLRGARIRKVLGVAIAPAQVADYLGRLGMAVTAGGADAWEVTPPGFRFDMTQEIDLIEEIARLHGYNRLPTEPPPAALTARAENALAEGAQALQAALVQRGYQEAITYSFVDPRLQRELDPQHPALALANPLASDMAVMRTTLWAGLLPALAYNQKRQQPRVRLFEIGLRFVPRADGGLTQETAVAGVLSGGLWPEQWGAAAREVDFFDLKADVEALLDRSGADSYRFAPQSHAALHPGQSAALLRRREDGTEEAVGWLGALHPALAKDLDVGGVYLFECRLAPLAARPLPQFQGISRFPSVRRDIAIVLDESVPAEQVLTCVREHAGELLTQLQLFDMYQGKGIDPGKKSLALGLTFRASSRNLTEEEVDTRLAHVLQGLGHAVHASLRE